MSCDSNKPQFHPLKLTHLLSIHVQAGVQVSSRVTCQEHREQASIFLRVWVSHITKLEVEFKTPVALVSPQLHPDLLFWYDSVPCEPLRCSMKCQFNINSVIYIQNVYFLCCSITSATFLIRLGTYTKGASRISSPPSLRLKVKALTSAICCPLLLPPSMISASSHWPQQRSRTSTIYWIAVSGYG